MSDRDITESIRHLAGTHLRDHVEIVAAIVDSVDIASRTCNVTTITGKQSTAIEGVKLMAIVDDGMLLIPTIGSTIFLTYSTYNVPFVALFSAVDQVTFIAGSSVLSIKDGLITLNDGSLGGLVEVAALVTRLNNAENMVNDLAAKFNGHTHILALSAGTGTAAATVTQETTTLTPTQRGDIENTKITHGQ
jgi:hypothetical protein